MIASQEFDEAVRTEVARENPGTHVIGTFTIACVLDPEHDDGHYYEVIVPAGQPRHSSLGLAQMGVNFSEDNSDDDCDGED